MSYPSIGIVELITNNHPESLVGGLGAEPGRHAGVDDHPDVSVVRLVQAQLLLHVAVGAAVRLLAPHRRVEDDLDTLVHQTRLLHRVAAADVELLEEVPLGRDLLVVVPGICLHVPGAAVDSDTIDKSVRSILSDKFQSLHILQSYFQNKVAEYKN